MFLNVTASAVELNEADDLQDLHVDLVGTEGVAAADAIAAAGFGELDGDHVWLDVGALRAAGPDTDDWRTGFEAMLGFAAKHGWTSDDRTRVRAHVVRS